MNANVRRFNQCGPGLRVAVKHLIPILIATILGSIAYIYALRLIWEQDIGNEYVAVLFAAFSSLLVAYPLVYLPVLRFLTKKLHGTKPYAVFPICAAAVGVVPVGLINVRWNTGFRAMLSPESQLFYIYFLVVETASEQ